MTQSRIQRVGDPAYGWEQLQIVDRSDTWTINPVNSLGDVWIECEEDDATHTQYLTQDELKEVIAFLQKQIKEPVASNEIK